MFWQLFSSDTRSGRGNGGGRGGQSALSLESRHSSTLMMPMGRDQQSRLVREGTMELDNDPRFYRENIINKRLAAFEALAIITELLSAEAIKICFEISHEFEFTGPYYHVAVMQVLGFAIMCSVMYMATVATAVLSLQLYYSIRLLTTGPTGFDKAARFYANNEIWRWRERAIFNVKWSLVLFTLAIGFMLYVKFWVEGGIAEEEREHVPPIVLKERTVISGCVLVSFLFFSLMLAYLVKVHQNVFKDCYCTIDSCQPGDLSAPFVPTRAAERERTYPNYLQTERTNG